MKRTTLSLWIALAALCVGSMASAESKKPVQVAASPARVARPATRSVEVLWGGSWWPAEILEVRSGLTKIHYTGWGPEWDEWVEPARLRTAAPVTPLRSARVGQRVSIEWHGRWWDGTVIAARAGFYKVHYTGWGPEWDEWLEPTRLRALRARHVRRAKRRASGR